MNEFQSAINIIKDTFSLYTISIFPLPTEKGNELLNSILETYFLDALAHSYASDVEPGGTIFIRRGGSWWHEAKNCRASRRYASDHSKKTSGLGLRVVIRDNVK